MTRILYGKRSDADPVDAAPQIAATTGVAVMSSFDVMRSLGVNRDEWTRFARHWQQLVPDPYAAELGVQRLRRYGQYSFHDGVLHPMPKSRFLQPEDSNPLYVGKDREFEPLMDVFAADPLLHKVIKMLARMAAALAEVTDWNVKIHPLRIQSSDHEAGGGDPTPEGMHRDGVTLVSSLLVGRRNAVGGESFVCDLDGRQLLATTLAEPGTLLVGDDRRTLHGVSPIRPIDRCRPAQRDVLVITFGSGWP